MVDVSELQNLEIYTDTGKYIGGVDDIVLNIKQGRVSSLKISAMEREEGFGLVDRIKGIKNTVAFIPEELEGKSLSARIGDVSFEHVKAVDDIVIVDSQVLELQPPQNNFQQRPLNNIKSDDEIVL